MRRNSLQDDARYETLRNQENPELKYSPENLPSQHEVIFKTKLQARKLLSVIVEHLEKHNVEIETLETRRVSSEESVHRREDRQNTSMQRDKRGYLKDIYVKCRCLLEDIKNVAFDLHLNHDITLQRFSQEGFLQDSACDIPWFPRKARDLDFVRHLQEPGNQTDNFDSDHPGFSDTGYRQRRSEIVLIALQYKHGEIIPKVNYIESELKTWETVYNKMKTLHEKGACSQYMKVFAELETRGLYSANKIPQLEDVSRYLRACTGFQLRPVAGLVSARDFLASLAVRVFQCTQYVRHHLSPLHTPEPDCCHELLGHVPMLCDPAFAQFSQEIGLASLGISDEDIEKLSALYWFTVEYGVCRQDGGIRAYGAGILSSYAEMEHALSDKPEFLEFSAEKTTLQTYEDSDLQPLYYVAESFADALQKVKEFTITRIHRPFYVNYNPTTEIVEVIRKKDPHTGATETNAASQT